MLSIKSSLTVTSGLLQTLSVLDGPWKSISLDFVIDLMSSKGLDVILTLVQLFTKIACFLLATKIINNQENRYGYVRSI